MKRILAFLLILLIAMPCFAAPYGEMSEYLAKAQGEGIIFGDEKGNLREDEELTRAEFLAIAVRFWELSGGENVFSDVSEKDWFCKSIAAANFCGIFWGTLEGEAKPREIIKTEDAITVIGRYYNATYHKGRYSGLSEYAESYFGYAFENGFFSGWRHLPNPKQGITKSQAVSLFYRYREQNTLSDCFAKGYPKLSQNQQFNSISVDIMTNTECDISYALSEKNGHGYNWVEFSKNQKAGEVNTLKLSAYITKTYDIYIKAVSKENGRTRISEITDISPLAFTRGNGSPSQPYVIYTENQLKQLSVFPDKAYVLGNDIKISEKWTPIKEFKGSIDGGGYRIEGIVIDDGSKIGLFESINGGTVKNLTVEADITAKENAGVIAGENIGGTIDGCCVIGSVSVSGTNGGGICGINDGEIKDCLSCVYTVKAGSFAGGIAGQNRSYITNCLSAAETVLSDMYSGGIAGTNNGGSISGCAAVNMAVYNTMTYNGGKISTNKNGGRMWDNYSYSDMVSNAAKTEMSADSRNGLELSWDVFSAPDFNSEIGWDGRKWKNPKNGFKLICPKNAAEPILEKGRTVYFPKEISTAYEFVEIGKNIKGHYVLTKDITLNMPWKTIDADDGFSGTIDGNGHTIYNLILKDETGIFLKINGGTVKNLNFRKVKATPSSSGGIITACNYGYIENCAVFGNIETERAEKVGSITAENNGQVENCTVEVTLTARGNGVTVGGICAENLGILSKNAFSGNITVTSDKSIVGGICGKDTEGYISECAADITLTTDKGKTLSGGICALSDGTQIYKCASIGVSKHSGTEILSGGICATAENSTVYNCFSQQNISVLSGKAVSGGICATAQSSNVQNTYSSGEIQISGEEAIAGGICATAKNSFITQNVALNPLLNARKEANAIVGAYEDCDVGDNYSCRKIRKNTWKTIYGEKNGTVREEKEILNAEFFLKPLSEKGLLGWDQEAWTTKAGYSLPILTGTPLMENAKEPTYK